MASAGLAFSGGGIRSAAFCSGVLRRLLEKGVEVDYLSCVSGGGYTGTAYLDWKYREERKARREGREGDGRKTWHKEFFDHMTQRAGYVCNWQEPLRGILDTVILSCLVLLVTVIQPIIKWGSYACPLAFIIDLFFGNLLRYKTDCDVVGAKDTKLTNHTEEKESAEDKRYKVENVEECIAIKGSEEIYTIILFTVLFILCLTSHFLLRLKRSSSFLSVLLRLSQFMFGSFLVFTFIPFTIYDLLVNIPLWAQLLVLPVFLFVWIALPVLRNQTSYILIIYSYSFVIYWKVYQGPLLGSIEYSDSLFYWMLLFSGFALWIVPLVTTIQERLVHVYNRWRLQKAFYHKDSVGCTGCKGIGLQDICPLWSCLSQNKQESANEDEMEAGKRPVSLADLKGMKPEYISNMVVNRWKICHESEEKYELLTMTPTRIERFDCDPNENHFEGRLEPKDVMLSDAMATSAAALSSHMGKYDRSLEGLTRLHSILGLEMGATMISDVKSLKNEDLSIKVIAYLLHILRGLPLIAVQTLYYFHDLSEVTDFDTAVHVALVFFFLIHLALAFIALTDTGAETPTWWEKLARRILVCSNNESGMNWKLTQERHGSVQTWFIVHISFVYLMREMFSKVNAGPVPPPILLLSDGGHVENLAILPLLKRRLPKIVVVDGGYKSEEKLYGVSLLDALMLARTKLNCSFISEDGHDVISDLLEKFVEPRAEGNPRYYKFKVRYQSDEIGEEGEGEILLIVPRDPQHGVSEETEGTVAVDLHTFDGPDELHHGMVLKEDEVGELTFCCCECCHLKACHGLSKLFCNVFPQHCTANQFFTPRLFSAYHREGYRACVEANADAFLKDTGGERQQRETRV